MAQLTQEELKFMIEIIGEISTQMKNPKAIEITTLAHSCINKMSKMIDETDKSVNK